ncbi:MAG: gamma-glutamyl-gamma-aminobutyrate hydrolase family protein [Alicyclobacillus sp.]|nr:gamma-glutamyl-gamma-aminobutyrate hydrolase family protein [Alicyclobacillus sp.]
MTSRSLKPLIGISGTRFSPDLRIPGPNLLGVSLGDDYAHGVETAGGLPLVIPFLENAENLVDIADRIDGLLLSGGEDVDPLRYGEQPQRGLGNIIPERDELELQLIRAVVERRKPILAICRGIQVLNVAFGGTLYQDLPSQWRSPILHAQHARRAHLSHDVRIAPDSLLYRLLGERPSVRTNSFHHQAVKSCGDGLRPVAWDADGLIEAVEHEAYPFVVGVQWHPENLWRTASHFLGLFKGLVDAAANASGLQ